MKHCSWILLLALPLTLASCTMPSWFADEEEVTEAAAAESQDKYVTLNVQDRWGFRIKEPMGTRTTGGSCAIWKDSQDDAKGSCCWNTRGECSCPCPERE